MYKDGYYYMTSVQGGTAGPATIHMIVSARARSLEVLWDNSPYNPIVRTKHRSETWWSKCHETLVDTWYNGAIALLPPIKNSPIRLAFLYVATKESRKGGSFYMCCGCYNKM